jgi:LuxR family maltose regulon positive regulatory protein
MARSSECRVVAVTAPAGYGKSTFLAEWAGREARRSAWVSFDRFDGDPVLMLTVLASAYGRIDPTRADLAAEMRGLAMSALAGGAPLLGAAFAASPAPFVLFLDDLHELQSPSCHDVLEVLIGHLPLGSQLVTASRSEQPHIPRLRASGSAVELGPADLALDQAGAQEIFSAEQISLSPELASALIERTEGWPVGIYLAAMMARDNESQLDTITGDDRYVTDYLYREAFSRHSAELQAFLRRTAVLDRLSGDLCDAVLDSSDASDRLRRLEAANSFVIALDRRREWYRYHDLYREFLLGELRHSEPGIVQELHSRAADWYQSHGSRRLAVEHLLRTSEHDRTMRLICDVHYSTFETGQLSTVLRWIATLGDTNIQRYPPLALVCASFYANTGDTDRAERWAAFATAASFDQEMPDGWPPYDSLRAQLRADLCANGPETMLTDATFAEAEMPPWPTGTVQDGTVAGWRPNAIRLLAEAQLLAGDAANASALFAQASREGARWGHQATMIISESQLALLAMDRGDWEQAANHVNLALDTIDDSRMQDYVTSLLAFAAGARLAAHHGNMHDSHRHLAHAMRGRPAATYVLPLVAVRLRLHLAKAYLSLADQASARQLLREIDNILLHRPDLGALVDQVEQLRESIASGPQRGVRGAPPLTPAELRLLPYLQTYLSVVTIAERLYVSPNTVKSELKSIYRKLGVSSRRAAIEQATAIGLLGR